MNDDKTFDPEDQDDQNDLEFLNRGRDPEDDDGDFELDDDYDEDSFEAVSVDEPEIPSELQDEISADLSDNPPDDVEQTMARPVDSGNPGSGRSGSGPSRIMISAGIVVVALAIWVFWPRGGGVDEASLGDPAVLTLDPDGPAVEQTVPQQSSDVDLADEVQEMVPEQPESGQAAGTGGSLPTGEVEKPVETTDKMKSGEVVKPTGGSGVHDEPAKQSVAGEPSASGKWAIQLGSFVSLNNAQRLADSLKAKGYRVEMPAIRSNSGSMSYKVWIAYFETRADADKWAKAHADGLGGDFYITHR